jgi:hypothetical protein
MTSSVSLSCYITPPNQPTVDFADKLAYLGASQQVSVTQNFGRQGDTATLSLIDGYYSRETSQNVIKVEPTFTIPSFSLVKLIDNNALSHYGDDDRATIFYGYNQDPSLYIYSANEVEWALSCLDFTGYANASINQGTYEGIPMGNAIVDIVKKANCGITAALVADGGFVQPGPNLPRVVLHYSNLTSGLQKISKYASGQSAYGWYIDSQLRLHYYDQQQAPSSGVTVTDMPTQSGLFSYTECHIDLNQKLQYEFDGTTLFNRALVVGKRQTISANTSNAATDSFIASGSQTQFQLSQVPATSTSDASTAATNKATFSTIAGAITAGLAGKVTSTSKASSTTAAKTIPYVSVNGVGQTASVYDGTTTPTTQWTIKQQSNGSWSLVVTPNYGVTPRQGASVQVWYHYQTTITAQADLKQSQKAIGGPNQGIFATVVNQSSIDSTASAYARATRELAEYGHPQERMTFTTTEEWIGVWRAGMTFELDSKLMLDSQRGFAPGLKATFIITAQTVTFSQGGYRQWQVTAIRVS